MIRQVCLFCGCNLGSIENPEGRSPDISHGICIHCFPKLLAGKGMKLRQFLDSFPLPVFLVDEDARVLGANQQGLRLLSKDLDEVQGHLAGEFFACGHSREPGGCRQTVHCKTCTIRRSIIETHESGRPCTRQTAFMDLGDITGDRSPRFLISTWKVAEAVMLRIDEVLEAAG